MKIEFEKNLQDGIRGTVKGWASDRWSGDSSDPQSYDFTIYSPLPGQVTVKLYVRTCLGHLRYIKRNQRMDLKSAIARHYEAKFSNCTLVI